MTVYQLIKNLSLVLIAYNIFDSIGILSVNYFKTVNEVVTNFPKYFESILVTIIVSLIIYLFFYFSNNKKGKELIVDPSKRVRIVIIGVFLSVSILKNLPDISIMIATVFGLAKGVTLHLKYYWKLLFFLVLVVLTARVVIIKFLATDETQKEHNIDFLYLFSLIIALSFILLKFPFSTIYLKQFIYQPIHVLTDYKFNFTIWGIIAALIFTKFLSKSLKSESFIYAFNYRYIFSKYLLFICYCLIFPHFYSYIADVVYSSINKYIFNQNSYSGLFGFSLFRSYNLFLGLAFTIITILMLKVPLSMVNKSLENDVNR